LKTVVCMASIYGNGLRPYINGELDVESHLPYARHRYGSDEAIALATWVGQASDFEFGFKRYSWQLGQEVQVRVALPSGCAVHIHAYDSGS
jgi:hypothetical protein